MSVNQFQQLIGRAESETLDFKENGYDLRNSRNTFIKDVVAMANTPREWPSHIVLGVRWKPESGCTIVGLEHQLDDAQLQDALGQDRVQPIPQIIYKPIEFEGKQVGILEILIGKDGPYIPVKDFERLQAGAVYYRRGTQNARAGVSELSRIYTWFQNGEIGVPDEQDMYSWSQFLDAVHHFDQGTTYLLAVDRISAHSNAPVHALGLPQWRAVIDFDPESDASGFLGQVLATIEHHRVVHRVVRGQYQVQPEPGTHWFFARGLSGRQETLSDGNHRAWLRAYKRELGKQLDRVAGTVSPSPVVALILWTDVSLKQHLRTLMEELHGSFGESVEIVVLGSDEPSFAAVAEDSGATFVRMSLRSLCSGLEVHFADIHSEDVGRCVLPAASGSSIEIDSADFLWMQEGLDLVHRSIGLTGDDDATQYRLGADIEWRNLHLRHDCDRNITPMVRSQVEADLRRRQTVRINLYHAPGSGGTTVGRRIAWELHNMYPVGILRRSTPDGTAERIAKVAALTELARIVLVLVDGEQHSEREIDDLYEFLKASQIPAVLLQVLRRFHSRDRGRRQFWLDAKLNDVEADRFLQAYTTAVPLRRNALARLARVRTEQRNAFFFGLTAFGQDFRGLRRYVENRMVGLTNQQRKILVFIAISHFYGQQSVPAQAFASLLGLPQSRKIKLPSAFADDAAKALGLLIRNSHDEWRTAHHLIALEIMQQVLASNSLEREGIWKQNLSQWGREFADFCQRDDHQESDQLMKLVQRVFIYRDNTDVLGTERAAQQQFSQLIEDIPSSFGKIDVLEHLTSCFPLEAHFYAHLGRLLSQYGEYDKAINHVDYAISLQPEDHVLHHMRGMILRQNMRAKSEERAPIDELIDIAKDATENFESARQLKPDQAHGYVSEVQMLINLVDHAGKGQRDIVHEVLAQPTTDPFLKRALEKAEDLLDRVNHLHSGEQPSRYIMDCRARLQRFYGDYQSALQVWDNLLSRPGVAKPPVRRQIVWTILRRRGGVWGNINYNEANRIQRLLEDNLEEEINDSTSLRLWLRAIRQSRTPPSLDSIIEKVSYWKTNTGVLDAAYYLYVLHTLRALEGSSQGAADAERALDECRALSRYRRDRTRSFEWIGHGKGVSALVHQSRLGDWVGDFWDSVHALIRINGRIGAISGPHKGFLELAGGVNAFFVPAKSGLHIGRDENVPVSCYIGFSYDGPRAWDVQLANV